MGSSFDVPRQRGDVGRGGGRIILLTVSTTDTINGSLRVTSFKVSYRAVFGEETVLQNSPALYSGYTEHGMNPSPPKPEWRFALMEMAVITTKEIPCYGIPGTRLLNTFDCNTSIGVWPDEWKSSIKTEDE
ncbi:hypothetical protein LWI28_015151 [Acer negundo]|uniref:Uncharacterized protein n=1 Tax=Acer negundo TaxID=4023 RepID=A0AAD5NRI0_ACENE|nr:hypothetical protein LWI28_015151 [Acer negundo]